jgi:imidazolonepropionase-like amidohydrolase
MAVAQRISRWCGGVAILVGAITAASAEMRPLSAPQDLVIRNARLWDGTGAKVRPNVSILIKDGRIARIGDLPDVPGITVLDVQGDTVLPGLIDGHVHVSLNPGSKQRSDTTVEALDLRHQHLRAYLACGITTVLDTGITAADAREVDAWLAAGNAGPEVLMLMPALTTPQGYATYASMGQPFVGVASAQDIEDRFNESRGLPVMGVKVFMESGFGPFPTLPVHGPAMRDDIVRAAAKRKLPIYVHAFVESDQHLALDLGAHALVHAGFTDKLPSAQFIRRLAGSGAYVVSTIAIEDSLLIGFHPERLKDPLLQMTVPAIELKTAADPRSRQELSSRSMVVILPRWMPAFLYAPLARLLATEDTMRGWRSKVLRAVGLMHAAKVPIVMGSDSGNWPIIPYEFHGPTSLRELELLGEAGLKPDEALAAATRVAAAMLGKEDDIGTIEVGKRGDLVVIRGDPLRDLHALRDIQWTVRNGVARTPQQWMHSSTETGE